MKAFVSFLLFFSCQLNAATQFQSAGQNLTAETVTDQFDVIWGFDFLPDGKMILTERKGDMSIFDPQSKKTVKIEGVPKVVAAGQGGLLDVVLHPNFAKNHWVYFSYAVKANGGNTTRIARAHLTDHQLKDLQILFTASPSFSTTHHYGSRIVFDGKGHIFFTVGDRGQRELAQDLSAHNGKVLRLNEDGSVPADNPFVDNPKAKNEIWSYGQRNPQGLFYDRKTDRLFAEEHGPRGGDEINIVEKGKNYGWPVISYGKEYVSRQQVGEGTTKAGMEQPLHYFTPSIAPGGFIVYRDGTIESWNGSLLSTALALTHLNRLEVKDGKIVNEERLLKDMNERMRAIRQAPDGSLWISTDSGKLIRVSPSPAK